LGLMWVVIFLRSSPSPLDLSAFAGSGGPVDTRLSCQRPRFAPGERRLANSEP
jgi:hypothetical protein